MITLKQAQNLDESELKKLKQDIFQNALKSPLNAYINDESSFDLQQAGIPILIKDNINVKNWEITAGSGILKGYIAPYDASAITRLKNAGFLPFGRANMDEFAMGSTSESSIYGSVKNPCDLSRVAGGSSGGSAAAVAGGIAIAALGSDTGGSIRQPAGYCGCVGLKPTYGAVSRYGLIAYSSSLDVIGPITQDVSDCAILFDAIKGFDEKDSTSQKTPEISTFKNLNPNKKFTIGILPNLLTDANIEIQNAYNNLINVLKASAHTIKEVDMMDFKIHISSYYITSMAEASSNLARFDGIRYGNRKEGANLKELYEKTRSSGFGDEVKRRILIGNFVLSSGYYDAYYLRAARVRDAIISEYENIFKSVDVILCPVAPNVAPKLGSSQNPLEMYLSDVYTIGVNLAGIPAISLPIGKNKENLPIGMQIIGNYFREQDLLDLALHIENLTKEQ